MAGPKRPIPTLDQLDRYNVNRVGQIEGIRQTLYDFQPYAAAGQVQLSFFQVPQGSGGKTLADTNMEVAGSLPSPKRFLIESIEVHFFPLNPVAYTGALAAAFNLNDTYAVCKSGWLELFIGSKAYLDEAPIGRFPPAVGLAGLESASDATTAAAALHYHTDYARFAGKPYDMDPPILLVPTQNFKVTLNWPALVPITVAGRIGVVLCGILYRNSQ